MIGGSGDERGVIPRFVEDLMAFVAAQESETSDAGGTTAIEFHTEEEATAAKQVVVETRCTKVHQYQKKWPREESGGWRLVRAGVVPQTRSCSKVSTGEKQRVRV